MILKKAGCPRKTRKARKDLIRHKFQEVNALATQHVVSFRVFRVFRGLIIGTAGSARPCDL
jgi:hypothetical protein